MLDSSCTGGDTSGTAMEILKCLLRCNSNRSEEHTSELQSQSNLVCRLLLEKKKSSISKFFCASARIRLVRSTTTVNRLSWRSERADTLPSFHPTVLPRLTQSFRMVTATAVSAQSEYVRPAMPAPAATLTAARGAQLDGAGRHRAPQKPAIAPGASPGRLSPRLHPPFFFFFLKVPAPPEFSSFPPPHPLPT